MRVGGFGVEIRWIPRSGGEYRRITVVLPSLVVTRRAICLTFGRFEYADKKRDDAREWAEIRNSVPAPLRVQYEKSGGGTVWTSFGSRLA